MPATGWGACLGVVAFVALVGMGRTDDGWMPFLDGINLVFHEAGHPVFGLLGWEPLTILGGTLMQGLVPILVGGHFLWRRQALGVALAGAWFGQNFLNIARYMADARAEALPLVGGGEHDWATLLGRWGLLDQDLRLASRVATLGWVIMVGACGWMAWRALRRPSSLEGP